MNYNDFLNKYNNEMFNKINLNRNLIIKSFTEYYGEEYKELIEKRFDNVIFYSFIPYGIENKKDIICKNILNKKIKYTANAIKLTGIDIKNISYKKDLKLDNDISKLNIYDIKDKYNKKYDRYFKALFGDSKLINFNCNIRNFINYTYDQKIKYTKLYYNDNYITNNHIEHLTNASIYCDTLKTILNEIDNKEKNIIDFVILSDYIKDMDKKYNIDITNEVVGNNNKNVEYDLSTINQINNYNNEASCVFVETNNNKMLDITFLPILLTTDIIFFHELNHQIVTSHLANLEYNNIKTVIHKSGLDNTLFTKKSFEELFNQKTSEKICSIFHKHGGRIFNYDDDDIDNTCIYNAFYPLIDDFFNILEEPLKIIRISENHNTLYKYVDKKIFLEYREYVNTIVNVKMYNTNVVPVTKNEYNTCKEMVKKMIIK